MEDKPIENQEDEINLLDYLIVLAKRKSFIIKVTLGFAVITAIISLIMSPIYKAETKILPPTNGGSGIAAQLMNQLGQLGASSWPRRRFHCREDAQRALHRFAEEQDRPRQDD